MELRPARSADGATGPGRHEHLADHVVLDDGQSIGRIYESRAPMGPEQAWFWSITVIGAHRAGIATHGHAPSLEDAKAVFQTNWMAWQAFVNDPDHEQRKR